MSPIFYAIRLLCMIMKTIGGLILFIDSSKNVLGLSSYFFFNTENNPKRHIPKSLFFIFCFLQRRWLLYYMGKSTKWGWSMVSWGCFYVSISRSKKGSVSASLEDHAHLRGYWRDSKLTQAGRNPQKCHHSNPQQYARSHAGTYTTIYHHNVPHSSYNVCSLMWKKLQLYFFLNWLWKLSFRDYSVTRSFQQNVDIEHNLIIKVMRRPIKR